MILNYSRHYYEFFHFFSTHSFLYKGRRSFKGVFLQPSLNWKAPITGTARFDLGFCAFLLAFFSVYFRLISTNNFLPHKTQTFVLGSLEFTVLSLIGFIGLDLDACLLPTWVCYCEKCPYFRSFWADAYSLSSVKARCTCKICTILLGWCFIQRILSKHCRDVNSWDLIQISK